MRKKTLLFLIVCLMLCTFFLMYILIILQFDNQDFSNNHYVSNRGIEYSSNKDGTYTCQGRTFLYKIVVKGKSQDAVKSMSYTVLTNNENLTYDDVISYYLSSQSKIGYPDFIVLE